MEIAVLFGDDDADHAVRRKSGICYGGFLGGFFAIKGAIEVGEIQSFSSISVILPSRSSRLPR